MTTFRSTLFIGSLTLFSVNALAEEAPSPWQSEAELGFIKTGGNSETESLNAKVKAVNETSARTYTGKLEGARTKDKTTITGERYFASGKGEYNLNEKSYLFALMAYEDDRFSGYDMLTTESVGYGLVLIKDEIASLKVEVGFGAKQASLVTGGSNNEGIVRAALDYQWKISATSTFTQDLSIESGSSNTATKSVTGLKSVVSDSLSSKITYTLRNNSDVTPGTKETDTELAVTMVYAF